MYADFVPSPLVGTDLLQLDSPFSRTDRNGRRRSRLASWSLTPRDCRKCTQELLPSLGTQKVSTFLDNSLTHVCRTRGNRTQRRRSRWWFRRSTNNLLGNFLGHWTEFRSWRRLRTNDIVGRLRLRWSVLRRRVGARQWLVRHALAPTIRRDISRSSPVLLATAAL